MLGISEVLDDALQPLVSAEASGDHPIGQGQAGHLGQGLRQIEGVGYCDRLDIGEQVFA